MLSPMCLSPRSWCFEVPMKQGNLTAIPCFHDYMHKSSFRKSAGTFNLWWSWLYVDNHNHTISRKLRCGRNNILSSVGSFLTTKNIVSSDSLFFKAASLRQESKVKALRLFLDIVYHCGMFTSGDSVPLLLLTTS